MLPSAGPLSWSSLTPRCSYYLGRQACPLRARRVSEGEAPSLADTSGSGEELSGRGNTPEGGRLAEVVPDGAATGQKRPANQTPEGRAQHLQAQGNPCAGAGNDTADSSAARRCAWRRGGAEG